jgi:hypothetical protein
MLTKEKESRARHTRYGQESAAISEGSLTPVISNCAVLPDHLILPPIELPLSAKLSCSDRQHLNRKACFSRADEKPIVMTHVLGTDCRTGLSSENLSDDLVKQPLENRTTFLSSATMDDSVSGLDSSLILSVFRLLRDTWRSTKRETPRTALRRALEEARLVNTETVVRSDRQYVRGIRNYGQTCFLNSVLQSLATLEPFMIYLERLVKVNEERHEFAAFGADGESMASGQAGYSGNALSGLLLGVLNSVNGVTNNDRIDTRGILEAIATKHPQFRSKHGKGSENAGKEQQDAEELLQALISVVADEAEFDLQPSCIPAAFVAQGVVGFGEDILSQYSSLRENRVKVLGNSSTDSAASSSKSRDTVALETLSLASNSSERYLTKQEEKKQEEFEMHIPRVDSEDMMYIVHLDQVDTGRLPRDREFLSDGSLRGKSMSAAMRIMMTTTSSISPSPLCFWMGSVLQCRGCKHVRPIQNTIFFNLPIIPTSVTNYLSPSSRSDSRGEPPTKCIPSSAGPPCTLEECLKEFTAFERVHDVECRCCTLRREKAALEEEVCFLSDAVDGLLARAKRTQAFDDLKHLQCDLRRAQTRLTAVAMASPDSGDPLESVLRSCDLDNASDSELRVKLERRDFFKCLLLTRLPSILTIHIQRRYYDPATNRMSKTIQHVIFPELLDVSPYCAYGGRMPAAAEWIDPLQKLRSSTVSRPIHYRLLSVIEHCGGAFYGHYVCYRRDQGTGRWLFISDDKVKVVEWVDVCCCQAYMLFYEAMAT